VASSIAELGREVAAEHRALSDQVGRLLERVHALELQVAVMGAELRTARATGTDYRAVGFGAVGAVSGLAGVLKAFGVL
jgi:hypothetical protein